MPRNKALDAVSRRRDGAPPPPPLLRTAASSAQLRRSASAMSSVTTGPSPATGGGVSRAHTPGLSPIPSNANLSPSPSFARPGPSRDEASPPPRRATATPSAARAVAEKLHRSDAQVDRFDALQHSVKQALADQPAHLRGPAATTKRSPSPDGSIELSPRGVPGFATRALERREVRERLFDEQDRRAPAFRHAQRVDQQAIVRGFDLVRETNALLDSKTAVATVLHEHKEQCRAREAAEDHVSKWTEGMLRRVDAVDDDHARLRAIERDDELHAQGDAVMASGVEQMQSTKASLEHVKGKLAWTTEQLRQQEEMNARKKKVRSVAINSEMTFDCCFTILEAVGAEGDGDSDGEGGGEGHSDKDKLLMLCERRLVKRTEALQAMMNLLERKDYDLRHQRASYESKIVALEEQTARAKALAEVSASGIGFTQLWALIDSDDADLEAILEQALKRALAKAKEQVKENAQNAVTTVNDDVRDAQKRVRALEGVEDEDLMAIHRDRNGLRVEVKKLKKRVADLDREVALKDEIIGDQESSTRQLRGELEALDNLAKSHHSALGQNDVIQSALKAEIDSLQQQLDREKSDQAATIAKLNAEFEHREEVLQYEIHLAKRTAGESSKAEGNKVSLKNVNLEGANRELHDDLDAAKEQVKMLKARLLDLQSQLDACLRGFGNSALSVVQQLAGCRGQVGTFCTPGDFTALRECVWRATGDAIERVIDSCNDDEVRELHSRRPDLEQAVSRGRKALAVDLAAAKVDPNIARLQAGVDKLTQQNTDAFAKLRNAEAEKADMRDSHRRSILSLKRAVINLVSRRNKQQQALPEGQWDSSVTSAESELNDLFQRGFDQLETEATERAATIAARTQESKRAKNNLIELADNTALPVRRLLNALASTCQVLRAVSAGFERAILPEAARLLAEGRRCGTLGASDGTLATTLITDISATMRQENMRLILDTVRLRSTAKARLDMYQKRFLVADDDRKDLVRRQMNHVEVKAYRNYADLYTRFAELHERKMGKLAQLAALTAGCSADVLQLLHARGGGGGGGDGLNEGGRPPPLTADNLERNQQLPPPLGVSGGEVTSPASGTFSSPAALRRAASSMLRRKQVAAAAVASGGILQPTKAESASEQALSPPSDGPLSPPRGPRDLDPLNTTARSDLVYDDAHDDDVIPAGVIAAVDAARGAQRAAEGAYLLLRRSVADALKRLDAGDVAQRFATLVDETPGSSALEHDAVAEVAGVHRLLIASITDMLRRQHDYSVTAGASNARQQQVGGSSDSSPNLVHTASAFNLQAQGIDWRAAHDDSGAAGDGALGGSDGGGLLAMLEGAETAIGRASPRAGDFLQLDGVAWALTPKANGPTPKAGAGFARPPPGLQPRAAGAADDEDGSPMLPKSPVSAAATDPAEQQRLAQLARHRRGLRFDEHGFAQRTDIAVTKDVNGALVSAAKRPDASTSTADASTGTSPDLVAELVLRLVSWDARKHDAAAALQLASATASPTDGLRERDRRARPYNAAVRNHEGCRQLPVGFALQNAEHRQCLTMLHSAVRYLAMGGAASAPQPQQGQYQPRPDDNDAATTAERHRFPSGVDRPTSATTKTRRDQGAARRQRGAAVEPLPGGGRLSPLRSRGSGGGKPSVPMPVVSFPARFEAPADPEHGGPTEASGIAVDLYPPHRTGAHPGTGADVYATMADFFDISRREREELRVAAIVASERAKSALASRLNRQAEATTFVAQGGPAATAVAGKLPRPSGSRAVDAAPSVATSKRVGSAPARKSLAVARVRGDVLAAIGTSPPRRTASPPAHAADPDTEGPAPPPPPGPKQAVVSVEPGSMRTRMEVA